MKWGIFAVAVAAAALIASCETGGLSGTVSGGSGSKTRSSPTPSTNPSGSQANASSHQDRLASLLAGRRLDLLVFESGSKKTGVTVNQAQSQAATEVADLLTLEARAAGQADDAFVAYIKLQATTVANSFRCFKGRCHPFHGAPVDEATVSIKYGTVKSASYLSPGLTVGEPGNGGIRGGGSGPPPMAAFQFLAPSASWSLMVTYSLVLGTSSATFSDAVEACVIPSDAFVFSGASADATYSINVSKVGRNYAGKSRGPCDFE